MIDINGLRGFRVKSRKRASSPSLVCKRVGWPDNPWDEVDAIVRAASLGIRVPNVRRVVSLPEDDYAIIMDRICGKTLEQLWLTLGLWRSLWVGWQLRRVVRSLQTVKSQTTGGLRTGKTESVWIDGIHQPVPFATPAFFTDYLNWWLIRAPPSYCPPRPELLLKTPSHHVFIHQDLAPRNLIVDDSGRLWIVDWGRAGFYPSFMEALAIGNGPYTRDQKIRTLSPWLAWWGDIRWILVRWIAYGWHPEYRTQRSAMATVNYRSTRFRLLRPDVSADY